MILFKTELSIHNDNIIDTVLLYILTGAINYN